ncbi:alcohol dehydrogenase [Desulfonema ishimotonii]|uniref:Alcohol dehydrogenase n=1 Tax=Desulfonema ishimotonii TaxID=45657 RepID=A0A401FX93_9BACT|nr:alcohol dehydrogenase catalytic domain-containing protein [Desulfonema ishimotonii]GBC61608.1 alcohol dehydrogenase [Desulfonema ishimotonii]
MKALQLEKIGLLNVTERPVPEPGPGEVRMRITHCAVCRTDAKMWQMGHRDLRLPRVLGHEICGILPESGERFVVWPGKACGQCAPCRSGQENLCRKMEIIGFHKNGGFAEYATVPCSALIPVPDDLPGHIACLAEPVACALNGLKQAGVRTGDRVLIYGAGPVGLMLGMAARAWGAHPFIRDIRPERLARNREFSERAGIGCAAPEETGFDAAINAAPASATFSDGLTRLKPGGTFCIFSGLIDDAPVPVSALNEIHYRQLHITGAYGCTFAQMKAALEILSAHRETSGLLIEDTIGLNGVTGILPEIFKSRALRFIVTPSPQP